MNDRTDRELVAAHVGGDRSALGAIYDRYAPQLYDTAAAMLHDRHEAADATHDVFVAAASHLHNLREPDRLRSWLFAVLRNEVYRRSKRRNRLRPTEATAMREWAAPTDPAADGAVVEGAELGALVRAAAAGLDARDQLVLELTMRQGLEGADLADALGVTVDQSHVLVHRMRERAQRAVTAVAVARAGRRDCDQLDRLLGDWNGALDVTLRKRIARHVDNCATCNETGRKVAVLPMVAAAPAFALPFGLRARVFSSVSAGTRREASFDERGFPVEPSRLPGRKVMAAVAGVIVVIVAAIGAIAAGLGGSEADADGATPATSTRVDTRVAGTVVTVSPLAPTAAIVTSPSTVATTTEAPTTLPPTTAATTVAPTQPPTTAAPAPTTVPTTVPPTDPSTTAPPPQGQLNLSTATVDLGATAPSARLTLTNTGTKAVAWKLSGSAVPFTAVTTSGTLAVGAKADVVFALNRTTLAEGDISRALTIDHDGAAPAKIPVTVSAKVERNPVVTLVRASTTVACPWSVTPIVAVQVKDESALSGVVLSWTGPGNPGSVPMTSASGGWVGPLNMQQKGGVWRWTVTATDARGNKGTLSGNIVVTGC
ncbi:MAG: sigma-70 family RNA polymerase sigma factor [Acidimicrobiia bacterium]